MANKILDTVIETAKYRRWSAGEKKRIVEESLKPGASVSIVARNNDVNPSLLVKWRKQFTTGALMGIKTKEELVPISELKKLRQENRRLERLLGRQTAYVEVLRDAIDIAKEKKLISRQALAEMAHILKD